MKRMLSSLVLVVAAAALSGCYYDPGYSYVRGSGQGGDAYYGDGGATYVAPAYYGGYGGAYYDPYYGGGYYGCCYAPGVSVGVSSVWYSNPRRGRDDYRGHRDYREHAGQWQRRGPDTNQRARRDRDSRDDYRGPGGERSRSREARGPDSADRDRGRDRRPDRHRDRRD